MPISATIKEWRRKAGQRFAMQKRNVVPATKFPKFPELPVELRLMIWRAAMPGARVIELHRNPKNGRLFTDALQSAIMQACHESREGLKHFEFVDLFTEHHGDENKDEDQDGISDGDAWIPMFASYMNFTTNTHMISHGITSDWDSFSDVMEIAFNPVLRHGLQTLALNANAIIGSQTFDVQNARFLHYIMHFKGVKKVLCYSGEDDDYMEDYGNHEPKPVRQGVRSPKALRLDTSNITDADLLEKIRHIKQELAKERDGFRRESPQSPYNWDLPELLPAQLIRGECFSNRDKRRFINWFLSRGWEWA
ncbi:hypothetical protein B0J14DRAFT_672392 [Halenospora varia]|nr:hypothetical protein B0J14DRAFT_672392 [Halenospora varia]